MLETLFGNRTATLALLFLEREREVWATGISRNLGIPVNMVQKQLDRFERGKLIKCHRSGRRKLYTWDKTYPFLHPLQKLLQHGNASFKENPADGSYLSIKERLGLAESLKKRAIRLSPYNQPAPFAKSFESFSSYETWRKKQKNPWLL